MADIKEVYAQSEEYQDYVRFSGDKSPTVDKFLDTLPPSQREEFIKKYGQENQPEKNAKEDTFMAEYKGDHTEEEMEKLAENYADKLLEVDSLEKLETWFAYGSELVFGGEVGNRIDTGKVRNYLTQAGFFRYNYNDLTENTEVGQKLKTNFSSVNIRDIEDREDLMMVLCLDAMNTNHRIPVSYNIEKWKDLPTSGKSNKYLDAIFKAGAEYNKSKQKGNILDVKQPNNNEISDNQSAKNELEDVLSKEEYERIRSMYSDQNEVWLDRIRVKVLQSMNKVDGSVKVDDLPVEKLVDEVKKADELNDKEREEYRKRVEKHLQMEMNFDLVPPRALAQWERNLNKDIAEAKKKDAKANTSNEETVLAAVHERMDSMINDMANRTGYYFVDTSNIADVYDGYIEMIDIRNQNKNGKGAKGILDEWMTKYEQDFGLYGKTQNDAEKLEAIAKDTEQKLADFKLNADNQKILNALNANGVSKEELTEALMLMAKSDALDDQVLMESKTADKKDIHALANDEFLRNVTMLVNSDRTAQKQAQIPFAKLKTDLLNGQTYTLSAEGLDGAKDAWVNKKTSKFVHLAKKVGKQAPIINRLYAPVSKIDKLANARFEEKADTKNFRKNFWWGLAGNAVLVGGISASFAVASRIPGAQPYCAYASAGLALVGMTVAYQQRRRAAHAQGKKYKFYKDPELLSNMLLSAAAYGAVAWGRPEGLYAVMGANMVRNGYFSFKKAKKAGIKTGEATLMTVASVAITPLAAWGGQKVGNGIGDMLSAENGPFGHWSEQGGEIVPGEKHEIKTYDQKHIDKAETWNNSDGVSHGARYTPDGSQPMESAFHAHGTYNEALSNLQQHHTGWAPEAADVNLAKLENAHLLGAPDTPLAQDPSRTLGDIMGVTDANGNHITYEDVFKHLSTNPQQPLSPAEIQVMDKVALHISADANGHMGHLIPDVGIKPQDLYSYDPSRPDGIQYDRWQDPDRIIPGERVWVPNEPENIVPYIPPYFFAQVKKVKLMKEKIGSIADRLLKRKKAQDDKQPVKDKNEPVRTIVTPVKDDKGTVRTIAKPVKDDKGTVRTIAKPVKDDKNTARTVVTPGKADKGDTLEQRLMGLQGDNVYYGPTSGEVAYNEVEGLEEKAEAKKNTKPEDKKRYELTEKDKETKEYSEALSRALSGDANAIEVYRQKREKEESIKAEVREQVQKQKEVLKARQHENKGKMHGAVVADRFAEEDIHGVEMSENTPEGYKQAQKQREADKKEFKETGKIARFMRMFTKEK